MLSACKYVPATQLVIGCGAVLSSWVTARNINPPNMNKQTRLAMMVGRGDDFFMLLLLDRGGKNKKKGIHLKVRLVT